MLGSSWSVLMEQREYCLMCLYMEITLKKTQCLLNCHCSKTNVRVTNPAFSIRVCGGVPRLALQDHAAERLLQSRTEREKVPHLARMPTNPNPPLLSDVRAFQVNWQLWPVQLESFYMCIFRWNKSCCDICMCCGVCRFLSSIW